MGLRLWGIALEPFWPTVNASSASPTSVRCQWRTFVASRSMPAATQRERREEGGVPIARDDLRGHGLRREPERVASARASISGERCA